MFALAGSTVITDLFATIANVATGFLSLASTIFAWVISEPLLVIGLSLSIIISIMAFGRKLMKSKG